MPKLYTPNTWEDEVLTEDARYDILEDNGDAYKADMQINLVSPVTTAGSPVNAARMNNIENGIDDLDDALVAGNATNENALTAKTTPVDADKIKLLDSAASFAAKVVTLTNLWANYLKAKTDALYQPQDGWIPITATWTRTGDHTFTVSGDVTAAYRKGTKVRYKDGGAYEYGVIGNSTYSAPNTTITLITNSDYAMAATTITDKYISYIENPEGFPDWFNWSPTISGFSSNPTNSVYRWKVYNQTIKCFIRQGSTGTSNATTFTISAPIVAVTITNMQWGNLAAVTDNGTFLTTPGAVRILTAGTDIEVFKDAALGAFTASGTKRVYSANIDYQF